MTAPEVLHELAPTGRLRAAINFGNPVLAQRDPATSEPRGVSVELASELARRLGVAVQFVPFEGAGKVVEAADAGLWDVAFLANDPARADRIGFTTPYVTLEASFLVRRDSPLRRLDEFDRAGLRIAVGRGAAYELHLARTFTQAELVRAETSAGAVDLFAQQGLAAAAGVRQPLEEFARRNPGFRVIEGRFHAIEQAMGVPRGRSAALAYLESFLAQTKASGFIDAALSR